MGANRNFPWTICTRMKVVIVIGLPLLLMILGTVGYHQVEGWTWKESFYMTVITISTVGYSELHDMTEAGRMFSVLLILISFGSLAYCGSLIFGFILERGDRHIYEENENGTANQPTPKKLHRLWIRQKR